MADLNDGGSSNVRSGGYFIVRSIGECRRCQVSTPLIALALAPEHETLSMDADDGRQESIPDTWENAACSALLFYIETLPDSVQRRLAEFSRAYRYAYSAETQGSYWANHCTSCGALLEDHELFCEPDGAFLPMSGDITADLELIWIEEPIEAVAGGYSCDPAFFTASTET
jgi:hypothetical protein